MENSLKEKRRGCGPLLVGRPPTTHFIHGKGARRATASACARPGIAIFGRVDTHPSGGGARRFAPADRLEQSVTTLAGPAHPASPLQHALRLSTATEALPHTAAREGLSH